MVINGVKCQDKIDKMRIKTNNEMKILRSVQLMFDGKNRNE